VAAIFGGKMFGGSVFAGQCCPCGYAMLSTSHVHAVITVGLRAIENADQCHHVGPSVAGKDYTFLVGQCALSECIIATFTCSEPDA